MLCKRIIPCLDVDNGQVVKGINFQNLRHMGDPVALAIQYDQQGADELIFLDISATLEGRQTMESVVTRVAQHLTIPFTVGGGIRTLEDATRLLKSGADKIAINSAAVKTPDLINRIAEKHGTQSCVVALDVRLKDPKAPQKGWTVLIKGGREDTGLNALHWAQEAAQRGAGEILLTSWDRDGTGEGFDLALTRLFSETLPIAVIASGGAQDAQSFVDVFLEAQADAALAATMFHSGDWTVEHVKEHLHQHTIPVRLEDTTL